MFINNHISKIERFGIINLNQELKLNKQIFIILILRSHINNNPNGKLELNCQVP
jgi:hypothetical protein